MGASGVRSKLSLAVSAAVLLTAALTLRNASAAAPLVMHPSHEVAAWSTR